MAKTTKPPVKKQPTKPPKKQTTNKNVKGLPFLESDKTWKPIFDGNG